MQVERGTLKFVFVRMDGIPSGERVSNALVTCPEVGDNSGKLELIPHVVIMIRCFMTKGFIRFGRGLRPIS